LEFKVKTTYLPFVALAIILLGSGVYYQQQIAKEQSRAAELLEVQRKQKIFKEGGEAAAAKAYQDDINKTRAQQQRRY
jgi:hypothetical protein